MQSLHNRLGRRCRERQSGCRKLLQMRGFSAVRCSSGRPPRRSLGAQLGAVR
ncbi:hypothetical protein DND47_17065 [Pseudomonas syringae pv. syringae]|nr:hypothetical protein DND47_17065 [Pseudomonas syringae pv. syringae]